MTKAKSDANALTFQQNLLICEFLSKAAGNGESSERILELRRILVREMKAVNAVTGSFATTPNKSQ